MRTLSAEGKKNEAVINAEIEALENRHPGMTGDQWMPWRANDSALSMEHWELVQRRLNMRYETRLKRVFTPEQRAAAGIRLQAVRKARHDAKTRALSLIGNDEKTSGRGLVPSRGQNALGIRKNSKICLGGQAA